MIPAAQQDAVGNRPGGEVDLAVEDLLPGVGLDEDCPAVVDGAFKVEAKRDGMAIAVHGYAKAVVVDIGAYGPGVDIKEGPPGNRQPIAVEAGRVSHEERDAVVAEMERHRGRTADVRPGDIQLFILDSGGD